MPFFKKNKEQANHVSENTDQQPKKKSLFGRAIRPVGSKSNRDFAKNLLVPNIWGLKVPKKKMLEKLLNLHSFTQLSLSWLYSLALFSSVTLYGSIFSFIFQPLYFLFWLSLLTSGGTGYTTTKNT